MWAVPLVGRVRELTVFRQALARALTGAGGVLIVRGDPGIGKSALVAAALDGFGVTSFVGHAAPGGRQPGRAVSELAVAALAAGANIDDPAVAVFRRAIQALIGSAVADAGRGEHQAATGHYAATVGEGLLRLLTLAAERPVAVIEDLQWADADTVSVLEYMAQHVHGRSAALVVTQRTGEAAETDAIAIRLGRAGWSTTLDLGPLPRDAVDEMTSARLDGAPLPQALATDVRAFAEGVPLLVEEFVSSVLEDNSLRWVDGDWRYEPGLRPRPPETLRESIELRVGRIGFVGRRLLVAGALLGRVFDVRLVTRGLHLDVGTVAEAVRVATLRGLVQPESATDQVAFRHALIRDAVDGMLFPPERADVARLLLAELAGVDGRPADSMLEVAAGLAREAGHRDLAAAYYLRAGQGAIVRGAVHSGAVLVEHAVRLAQDQELAVTARIAAVDAHALTGHAAQALREGNALLQQLDGEPVAAAPVHLSMARAAAAGQLWRVAQIHLDAAGGATDGAAMLALRAVVAFGDGRQAEAIDHASRAATLAETDGPPAVACEAYEVLGRAAREQDLTAALAWFNRAAGLAERHGLVLWKARALHELATISQLRNLELDDLHNARQAALGAGAPGLLAAVDFHIAAIHGVRFEPEPALAAARRCLDEARRVGVVRQQAWGWILVGQAHACAGRRAQAAAAANEAERLAPGDQEILGLADGTCRGLASLLAGDRELAVTQFRAGIEHLRPLPRIPLPPWYLWPLIALVWTDTDGPRALAEADRPALRVAAGPDAMWWLAAAVAAGRGGDSAAAQTHLEHAELGFRVLPGFGGYRHIGLRLAAEAAIADGWGDPGKWLIEAETWSTRMGFAAFGASCRALQRRAGVRQRRRGRGSTPVPAGLAALGVTTREADVLTLVAAGMTNPQIADRLYISPRTVKSHLETLLRKTGSTGRTQLATLATASGITETVELEH